VSTDLLYALEWARHVRSNDGGAPDRLAVGPGTWIVFVDGHGVGDALAARLLTDGHHVVRVTHASTYSDADPTRVAIRADLPGDIDRLLREVLREERPSCRGVAYLWPLDAGLDENSPNALRDAQTLTAAFVVHLVQSLNRVRWQAAPRVWLVTRGAQAVEPGEPGLLPAGGMTWGLGRTLAVEHGFLWGGAIDLDPGAPADEMAQAVHEQLTRPDGEDQLAWRRGARHAARLRHAHIPPAPRALRWRPDASYLITGGFGELGLEVARWMVGQGARRVILLGRTPLPSRRDWPRVDPDSRDGRRVEAIKDLERRGASVHIASVDVADPAALRSFLEEFRAEGWPPIRGLVHAAGIADMQTLLEIDAASLSDALAAKATGAWLLHRFLDDSTLDFRVYFSSLSALLGSPRLASYAAANAFLDTLAHYERARGKPALSINWGIWAEAGMAARQRSSRHAAGGIGGLTTQEALDALDRLLRTTVAQAAVLRFDWHAWQQVHPQSAASPYLRALYDHEGASAGASRPTAGAPPAPVIDREVLMAAAPAERALLLESFLCEQVALVLQIPLARIETRRPLAAMGLDSMMAVQIKNQVDAALGVNVNLVKFLEGATIADIARSLSDDVAAGPGEREPPREAVPTALLDRLDQLTEDEVEALLLRMSAKDDPGP
jgi:NAD(P)-dependent dehydrogenase (short-subunit alcohol dehydrogenase family)